MLLILQTMLIALVCKSAELECSYHLQLVTLEITLGSIGTSFLPKYGNFS